MGVVTRNSLQYAKLHVNKYLARSSDFGADTLKLPFDHTHPSATAAGDIVNLCVIPANHMVVGMMVVRQAQASTAVTIGTVATANLFLLSETWAAAGVSFLNNHLGMFYRPTVDTIAIATFVTVDPTDVTRFAGHFEVIYVP